MAKPDEVSFEKLVIRVWDATPSESLLETVDCLEGIVAAQPGNDVMNQKVTLEIVQNTGLRMKNAILGAEYQPDLSTQLKIEVSYMSGFGAGLTWPLVATSENVQVGLRRSWARSTIDAILEQLNRTPLHSGRLFVNRAAFGEVGGDMSMVAALGRILVELLANPQLRRIPSELTRITRAALRLSCRASIETPPPTTDQGRQSTRK